MDVLTKVDLTDVVAGSDPVAISSGMGWAVGRSSTRSRCSGSSAFARGDAEWGGPDEFDDAFAGCCQHVKAALPSLWCDR
jgi:hypothetical protein